MYRAGAGRGVVPSPRVPRRLSIQTGHDFFQSSQTVRIGCTFVNYFIPFVS